MRKRIKTTLDYDSGARRFTKITFATLALSIFVILLGSISWGQNQQQSQPPQSPASQKPSTPPTAPQTQAQQQAPPQSQSKISTEVKLVTVYAAVRDKHGKIIPNLNQSDFALQEDARPQTIKHFARESDLPLTLGLLVDTSLSQRRVLDQEKSASYSFFDHILRETKDKASWSPSIARGSSSRILRHRAKNFAPVSSNSILRHSPIPAQAAEAP